MTTQNKRYTSVPTSEEWDFPDSQKDQDSDCSSSYSSYNPDFKNYIDEHGNLFYIKVHPVDQLKTTGALSSGSHNEHIFRNEYKRMSLRRDRGILSKLAGKRAKKSEYDLKLISNHKYQHVDGVLKELRIGIKPGKLNKLKKSFSQHQRDGSLFELIFDATISIGPDGKRFLIDKINEGSVFERDLLVGDIIKSIDGDVISVDNLNDLLRKIQHKKTFKVVAQECYKDEFESCQEELKIVRAMDIMENKEKLFHLGPETLELIFSLNLIRKNDEVSDDSEDFTTLFSFPPKDNNFIHKLKGSFLAIASIMKTSFDSDPVITSISVHDLRYYVAYAIRNDEKDFIFVSFNSLYTSLFDARQHATNLLKFLDFIYPNFMEFKNSDQLTIVCEMMKIQLLKSSSQVINFEQLFSLMTYVPLPKEIVLRINDSLSELEAMDYRNWNEDLMELFGRFNVIGSCLFYKTSLICSHFNDVDMENIELFIRHTCLKLLYTNSLVREVVMWQRVYPKQYQSFNMENDSAKNKVFLLIAAHGNLLSAVILEENGYNINPDMEIQSSNYLIYYLEEMEDILDHLKIVGIENLTRIWINSQKRPQVRPFIDNGKHEIDNSGHLRSVNEELEDDDSDWNSQIGSQKSSSGFDMTEFSDAIYKDFTDIIPQTLTFGPENVMYHFTQLDPSEGILITTLNDQNINGNIGILVDNFRRACLRIHTMLQNTIKFNQMLSKENNKILHSRSMTTVKEQGILIHLQMDKVQIDFWVVGRLFGTRELYVCYDAKIPQNMVEIAFRIALNCIG